MTCRGSSIDDWQQQHIERRRVAISVKRGNLEEEDVRKGLPP